MLLVVLACFGCREADAQVAALAHLRVPAVPAVRKPPPAPAPSPLDDEARAKGFNECNPPDRLGLGPYGPFHQLVMGKMLIPQKGGHTADMGYDVIVHLHGADAVRKLLVPTARGVSLVLIDKGTGGAGPYMKTLGSKLVFPQLRKSIERALQKQSGDERAHIRHLALTAWSAGGVAVSKLLEQQQEGIDAVVILDGLHGAWKQGARREQQTSSLDARFIKREIALADRARRGDGLFVLTHSAVDPFTFPATGTTARQLLEELGLRAKTVEPGSDPFGPTSTLDERGLHVWGFLGKDKLGHCAQLFHMPRIVTEILEPAWGTPAMDRSVKPTPHPDWAFTRAKHH